MASENANVATQRLGEGTFWLTRFVLLRLLGVVYLFAFLVAANQNLPLIGETGLLPAKAFLEHIREVRGSSAEAWLRLPTLFWIDGSDRALSAVAWAGVALSLLCALGFANAISMTILWLLYLSIAQVGQDFYYFGWELQLHETGFLSIFLCPLLDPRPFPRTPPPVVPIWLHRWLILRIMIGAGLIKLRGDGSWRDLTALAYHYETQPIPNAISRHLHAMPLGFHKFGCLWNHMMELVVPWFAFAPVVSRRAAGVLLVLFQVLLLLSGNLSFLNWLTIVPCLACLDDGVWRRVLPRFLVDRAERAAGGASTSLPQLVCSLLLLVTVAWLSVDPVANLLNPRQKMNYSFDALHLVNTYGAFGTVDKVRREIVLEGTEDEDIGPDTRWRAYEFKGKPGDPRRTPPWISPYHYRLDWLMWFAVKENPGRSPWAVHLIWKLLHNDPGTLSLMAGNPFPGRPPRYIRAEVYEYRFTRPGSGDGAVWARRRVGEWLYAESIYDINLRRMMAACGWLTEEDERDLDPKDK